MIQLVAAVAYGVFLARVWEETFGPHETARVAWHEAGHAIVGARCFPGVPIVGATIEKRYWLTRYKGVVFFAFTERPEDVARWPTAERWRLCALALGGIAGEVMRDQTWSETGCRSDLALARGTARTLEGSDPPWTHDPGLRSRDLDVRVRPQPGQAVLRLAYAEARRILHAEHERLARLARRLINDGALEGATVAGLLDEAHR